LSLTHRPTSTSYSPFPLLFDTGTRKQIQGNIALFGKGMWLCAGTENTLFCGR